MLVCTGEARTTRTAATAKPAAPCTATIRPAPRTVAGARDVTASA
ncbi:hypothetical protein I553_0182 [Mycobacterium xenopi 4042]|uniref:Uncharacterized protein n=1 Tax=Mycobacterium xenopi 4042 TaxID=1299334 RepID=X7YKQ7_MYCXE|nr:hypothetical protein I553_0182 [Mycobacterium xenopi 4042]